MTVTAHAAATPSRPAPAIPTPTATWSATGSASSTRSTEGPADDPAHADLVDHPLALLEDAGPVPRAPLPRGRLRRSRQRQVRSPAAAGGIRRGRIRRRRARGYRCHRHRARGGRVAVPRSRTFAAARRGTPERVDGLAFIAPALPLGSSLPRGRAGADVRRAARELGAGRSATATTGSRTDEDFLEFFFSQAFTEPHSTKQREDAVGWGLETDAETLVATQLAERFENADEVREVADRIRCPVLVIHGSDDAIRPHERRRAGRDDRWRAATLEGAGHCPQARDPVKVNLLLRDFAERTLPPAGLGGASFTRGGRWRRKRALYICSPIGLGHARRDLAIASELRGLCRTWRSTGWRRPGHAGAGGGGGSASTR